MEYDFGEIKLAAIHGRVHLSTPDGDCFGDEPEQQRPVVGAKVELWNADGTELLETTFTDDNGDYWFMNLRPGEYMVREYTPDHLLDGDEHVGEVGGVGIVGAITGTDASVGYDEISGIALLSGQSGEHYDFCEHEPAKISGFVYHDRDNDGVKETGEEGIAGVTMSLIDLDTGIVIAPRRPTTPACTCSAICWRAITKCSKATPARVDRRHRHRRHDCARRRAAGSGDTADVGEEMERDMIVERPPARRRPRRGLQFRRVSSRVRSPGGVYLSDPDGNCEVEPGQLPERPLAGVKISLYDGADRSGESRRDDHSTNEFGEYHFDGLNPGEYARRRRDAGDLSDGHEHVGSHGGIVIDPDNRTSVIGDIHPDLRRRRHRLRFLRKRAGEDFWVRLSRPEHQRRSKKPAKKASLE